MDIFQYSRLKIFICELLPPGADVVNRDSLKPRLRDIVLRDSVNAF